MAQPVVALNTARSSIEITRADASARCVCGNCMARAMALTISPEAVIADA